MGITPTLIGILAQAGSRAVQASRILTQSAGNMQGVSQDLNRRITLTQPSFTAYSVIVVGTTILAFSQTGRYSARSTDGGVTWTNMDRGSNVDGVWVLVMRSSYYGAIMVTYTGNVYTVNVATSPPNLALQGPWAISTGAFPELDPTTGDIFLCGEVVTLGPTFYRSGFRIVQDANVVSAIKPISATTYYIGGMTRTVAGTYLGSMRNGSTQTAIGRSTNSTTWTFQDVTVHASAAGVTRVLQLPSGRLVYGRQTVGGVRDIRYSDDDGVTWNAATIPSIPANMGYPYWDAGAGRAVFLCADGVTAIVSTDGITWTSTPITGDVGTGVYYISSEFSITVNLA
jgi:hypothetical protein